MKMKREDRSRTDRSPPAPQGQATPWGRRIGQESHFSSYLLGTRERPLGIIHGVRGLSKRARVQTGHIQPWHETGSQEPCPIAKSLDASWLSVR